jgi:hypothetical protein
MPCVPDCSELRCNASRSVETLPAGLLDFLVRMGWAMPVAIVSCLLGQCSCELWSRDRVSENCRTGVSRPRVGGLGEGSDFWWAV